MFLFAEAFVIERCKSAPKRLQAAKSKQDAFAISPRKVMRLLLLNCVNEATGAFASHLLLEANLETHPFRVPIRLARTPQSNYPPLEHV